MTKASNSPPFLLTGKVKEKAVPPRPVTSRAAAGEEEDMMRGLCLLGVPAAPSLASIIFGLKVCCCGYSVAMASLFLLCVANVLLTRLQDLY